MRKERMGTFDSGLWAQLRLVEKSIYMAMRSYSYFDIETCREDSNDDMQESYKTRISEMVIADSDVLSEYAGITGRTLKNAILGLARKGLVQNDGDELCYFKGK